MSVLVPGIFIGKEAEILLDLSSPYHLIMSSEEQKFKN